MRIVLRVLRFVFSSVYLTLVTFVAAPVLVAVVVFAGLVFLPLPATIPAAKVAAIALPTVIYDADGNEIATLQQNDQSVPVTEAQVPQDLKEAVVADEDHNFYKEGGVDITGTIRAVVADIRSGRTVQGGSTITQQYVKLAYTNGRRTVWRKIKEAILAGQLSHQASKDQILYQYLTLVYFGDGNYGIGAAAENYFHEPVNDLTVSQAALLAGLIPAPSDRAPREHPAAAEEFRRLVLGKMRAQGYLTEAGYERALAQKVSLDTAASPATATVVYGPPTTTTQYPDFVDYVTRWLLAHYPASEVYGGGLRVQTTLDPRVQDAAYSAVDATLAGTAMPLDMSLAAVEPETGFVEAVVGGRTFGQTGQPDSDVNLALGGCDPPPAAGASVPVKATCWSGQTITGGGAGRQPGSSWKPFVLATAFEQGIPPSKVYSAPAVYSIPGCVPPAGQPASACQIHNDEGGSVGSETLAEAMAQSTNTVYAQLAPQVGCANVAATAKAMGVESAYYSPNVFPYCQSYALGEVDVSPLDMASAYGVFADHGQRAAPTPILKIIAPDGQTLVDNISQAPATTTVLPENVANNVTSVLEGVLTSGTGTEAAIGRPAAGKTGTTSNYTNAWFVGYTPSLSAAVWMGNVDSQSVSIGDVKGVDPVVGGTWPARTWKAFMTAALAGVPATGFSQPAPITPPVAIQSTTTTQPQVEPGPAGQVSSTPSGGPYQVPAPTPVAPYPVSPTVPSTLPAETTTTTTSTTTTTLPPVSAP